MTKVAVIGTGYVGLTTGACLAHIGHEVTCADIDERKVENLNAGNIPIVEENLDTLVLEGLENKTLRFVVGGKNAVADAEIVFLCLPTPQGEDGSADLTYVKAAVSEIASSLMPGAIVVNKSTVPIGSANIVKAIIGRSDIDVVSNPEFLREGSAVNDFLNPDRIVVGSSSLEAARAVAALYSPLRAKIVPTDTASAEMIKYAANAFLATKLSFVNSIAAVCEGVGANIEDVVAGVGSDQRIGPDFLKPGPGWGGSCFPKDTKALIRIADSIGYRFGLLESAVESNEQQISRIVNKVHVALGESFAEKTVGVWGLTFKAGTDDLRDSPAITIVDRIARCGATVNAYDPTVAVNRDPIPSNVRISYNELDAAVGADVLVVLTEWPQFKSVSAHTVSHLMKSRTVIDARNVLVPGDWIAAGFSYRGVGR